MNGTWLDRNRHMVFAALLFIAAGGAALFYLRQPTAEAVEIRSIEATATTAAPTLAPSPTPAPVRVYVTGAVVKSDVYFLPHGSIIKDAIEAAGGFTPDADPERINQALELQDQQQIHVPRQGNEANEPPPVQGGADSLAPPAPGKNPAAPAPAPTGKINLNTATLEQLDSLPGIGPAIAQRIIDYREKAGGFKAVEQITEVSGIGEATLAKIKDLVTVQ